MYLNSLIDTHCHLNMMTHRPFDTPLTKEQLIQIQPIIKLAQNKGVTSIINVGTSLAESRNAIMIARYYPAVWATVGIHPNDCSATWKDDLETLLAYIKEKEKHKIVGIGEVGFDKHYPGYILQRQKDAFKAQINLALEYDLALIVHTRDAPDETLKTLEEYKGNLTRTIIHCFSEDASFAQIVTEWGFALGIGGTLTYPKNEYLRDIVRTIDLHSIVLETDAPFLPIQTMRGKKNAPQYIYDIAHYIAELRHESFETIAKTTTQRARDIFRI
jgi:TatD DNase family protein